MITSEKDDWHEIIFQRLERFLVANRLVVTRLGGSRVCNGHEEAELKVYLIQRHFHLCLQRCIDENCSDESCDWCFPEDECMTCHINHATEVSITKCSLCANNSYIETAHEPNSNIYTHILKKYMAFSVFENDSVGYIGALNTAILGDISLTLASNSTALTVAITSILSACSSAGIVTRKSEKFVVGVLDYRRPQEYNKWPTNPI